MILTLVLGWFGGVAAWGSSGPPCKIGVIEGELHAGQGLSHPLGDGLKVWFQPIASGWILRVVPDAGPLGEHDYAELATPPYRSVTPLSLSTDFAFRAQDAVGWNPRRFKFATSAQDFARLNAIYERLMQAGGAPSAPLQVELSEQLAKAADAKLTILDAALVPGTADQWRMAAAVSSRFQSTAHTLVPAENGKPSALGKLLWVRFRIEFALPSRFRVSPGMQVLPHVCGSA